MVCGLLRTADIACDHRSTQLGQNFGGAEEVLVGSDVLEAAQAILASEP